MSKMLYLSDLNLKFEKGVNCKKGTDGEHFFIPSGAVFPMGIKLDKCSKVKKEEFSNISLDKVLKDGDILFNTGGVGTLGRVAYYSRNEYKSDNVCDSFVLIIRNHDSRVSSKYLFYWLQTSVIKGYIGRFTVGSTGITSIHVSDILKFPILLPSISEQKNVESALEKSNSLCQKRRASLRLIDEFLRSAFLEMFGDPFHNPKKFDKLPIGDIGDIITGNTPPRQKKEYYGDFIEWIKSDNINTPQFTLTKAKEYLSKEGAKVGRICPPGSVLVTCIAGSPDCIGNVAIADRKVAFNQQINAFVPSREISFKFFFSQVMFFKKLIQQTSTNGMKGLVSKSKFSDVKIIVPPIEVQNKFDAIFDIVATLRGKADQSLIEIDNYSNSLAQRAFRGMK